MERPRSRENGCEFAAGGTYIESLFDEPIVDEEIGEFVERTADDDLQCDQGGDVNGWPMR